MANHHTRNFKGLRQFESSGPPLHADNQTITKERCYPDKTIGTFCTGEITAIDHALTRPWTVNKTSLRVRMATLQPRINTHAVIGKEDYFVSADGYVMPG
jgi:hypothetical protein